MAYRMAAAGALTHLLPMLQTRCGPALLLLRAFHAARMPGQEL